MLVQFTVIAVAEAVRCCPGGAIRRSTYSSCTDANKHVVRKHHIRDLPAHAHFRPDDSVSGRKNLAGPATVSDFLCTENNASTSDLYARTCARCDESAVAKRN